MSVWFILQTVTNGNHGRIAWATGEPNSVLETAGEPVHTMWRVVCMQITEIETIALFDAAIPVRMTVVRVHTDEGITGIGQAESPSLVIDAICRCAGGLQSIIAGEDPLQVERLWQMMYDRTSLFGRRGVTIAAIGAVETALWDIAGKALGKPVCELIWRAFGTVKQGAQIRAAVTPYATIYPSGVEPGQVREHCQQAVARGFRAVKIEENEGGLAQGDAAKDVALVTAAREAIGDDRELLIDVQHRWHEVGEALRFVRSIEHLRPFLVEAPLPPDNYAAYARLADAVDTRIGVGDWGFATRFEFADLIERARVDVVQPSSVRSGGMAEILRIAEHAYRHGMLCIPHAWHHTVGAAAEIHLAAVAPNMPLIELPLAEPDSPIVSELLVPAIRPTADGRVPVPDRPGLGFELNDDVVERFRVAPC